MRFGEFDGNGFAVEQGEDGVAGIGRFDGVLLDEAGVVETAGVAETAGFIKDEHVGRREAAVGAGDELFFAVVEIGKSQPRLAA